MTIGVGIVMSRFHGKGVIFAIAGAVCVLTLIFTVGIVASDLKTVSSKVLDKGSETHFEGWLVFPVVWVVRKDAEIGEVPINIFKPDWDALSVGDVIKLSYHSEFFSGV
ncbi:hypothetical protein ACFLTP_02115 [Chloroflexota bacterium]